MGRPKGIKSGATTQRVLELVRDGMDTSSAVASALNATRRTANYHLEKLAQAGLLISSGCGTWHLRSVLSDQQEATDEAD
jgi:DNA-binding transcriptional ArsR family regulator